MLEIYPAHILSNGIRMDLVGKGAVKQKHWAFLLVAKEDIPGYGAPSVRSEVAGT